MGTSTELCTVTGTPGDDWEISITDSTVGGSSFGTAPIFHSVGFSGSPTEGEEGSNARILGNPVIPEPGTASLLAAGLVGLGLRRRARTWPPPPGFPATARGTRGGSAPRRSARPVRRTPAR